MIYLTQYLSSFYFAILLPVHPPMLSPSLQIYLCFFCFQRTFSEALNIIGFFFSLLQGKFSLQDSWADSQGAAAQRKVAVKQGVREEEEAAEK